MALTNGDMTKVINIKNSPYCFVKFRLSRSNGNKLQKDMQTKLTFIQYSFIKR
jgi:hypothetical protein